MDLNPDVLRSAAVSKLFVMQGRTQVSELLAALAVDDHDAVLQASHTLRGSAAVLGADVLVALCTRLEALPEERRRLGAEVAAAFDRVRSLLLGASKP